AGNQGGIVVAACSVVIDPDVAREFVVHDVTGLEVHADLVVPLDVITIFHVELVRGQTHGRDLAVVLAVDHARSNAQTLVAVGAIAGGKGKHHVGKHCDAVGDRVLGGELG